MTNDNNSTIKPHLRAFESHQSSYKSRKMKLNFFIFLIFLKSSIAADNFYLPAISCVYSSTVVNNVQHYVCNLAMEDAQDFDEFEEITGTHLEGRSDADVTLIQRYSGIATIIPQIICSQFPNLEIFIFHGFGLNRITDTSFAACLSASEIELYNNHITQITENAFANNRNLTYINLARNELSVLPENVFASQSQVTMLELRHNLFASGFADGLFSSMISLQTLLINDCQLHEINPLWFENLPNLRILNMYNNDIRQVPADAFVSLENLMILNLERASLRNISANAFRSLSSLQFLYLDENHIEDLPNGIFAPLTSLNDLGLRSNRLKTVRREHFGGDVSRLFNLDLDSNVINAVEEDVLNAASGLSTLFFGNNLCASGFFSNFQDNRAQNMQRLTRCFRNFEFSVGK